MPLFVGAPCGRAGDIEIDDTLGILFSLGEREREIGVARWTRAARKLDLRPRSRVLDLGCAFGFGTRFLATRYRAFGHDLSPQYIEQAKKSVPSGTFTCGSADSVPYPDGFFDGIVMLDVLEHVPREEPVIDELARVLRPGGRLILSVPHRGALSRADSLNVYQHVFRGRVSAPTDDPSWPASPRHRHYTLADMRGRLEPGFRLLDVEYSGLGIAELVNLPLLMVMRPWQRLHRLYDLAQYLYFGVYLLEDMIPTGSWGYHMMITAERA